MSSLKDQSIELKRKNETVDIVKRIGVITPDKVNLTNHPAKNPATIFNPTIIVENDVLKIFARIVLGYFTYSSAVIEMSIPIEKLEDLTTARHHGRIVLMPDNKYDIWGVEDPRVCKIEDKFVITYSARTVNYFRSGTNRVLPIVAIREGDEWQKRCVFTFNNKTVSDKNAFLTDLNGLVLFHRPHTISGEHDCVISEVSDEVLHKEGFTERPISNAKIPIKSAEFEEKIGWGSPPIEVGKEYLLLLHGLDKDTRWYKVFAVLIDKHAKITAVTPHYIMEPKESYEVYGDRPYTVFPCGLCRMDDKLIMSYGAADFACGIGEIDLSEIVSVLDANRI